MYFYNTMCRDKKDQRVSTAKTEACKARHEQRTDQTRRGGQAGDPTDNGCDSWLLQDGFPFSHLYFFLPLFRLHMGLLLRSCVYHSLYPILQRVISSSSHPGCTPVRVNPDLEILLGDMTGSLQHIASQLVLLSMA